MPDKWCRRARCRATDWSNGMGMATLDVWAWYVPTVGALLALPGPSNALATNVGLTHGMRAVVGTVPAVAAGYLLVISVALGLTHWLRHHPLLAESLQLLCALYLGKKAYGIWRTATVAAASEFDSPTPLRACSYDLFVATLLNPKGLMTGLLIIPQAQQGYSARLWLPMDLLLIFLIISIAFTASYTVTGGWLKRISGSTRRRAILIRSNATVIGFFSLALLLT